MDGVIPSDGEKKAPAPKKAIEAPAPAPAPKETPKAAQVEEEIEEPKKVTKKSAAPVEDEADLSKIIDEWDD
jgi:hypothetical protein